MIKQFNRDESGQGVGLAIFGVFILLIIATFLIDGGRSYYLKNHAYNIAEATALSAATDLDKGDDVVRATANEYADLQGIDIENVTVTITRTPNVSDVIVVNVALPRELFFGKLFGIDTGAAEGIFTYTLEYTTTP